MLRFVYLLREYWESKFGMTEIRSGNRSVYGRDDVFHYGR